eukprot:9265777-Pyramimonas_sp.AAC.1
MPPRPPRGGWHKIQGLLASRGCPHLLWTQSRRYNKCGRVVQMIPPMDAAFEECAVYFNAALPSSAPTPRISPMPVPTLTVDLPHYLTVAPFAQVKESAHGTWGCAGFGAAAGDGAGGDKGKGEAGARVVHGYILPPAPPAIGSHAGYITASRPAIGSASAPAKSWSGGRSQS